MLRGTAKIELVHFIDVYTFFFISFHKKGKKNNVLCSTVYFQTCLTAIISKIFVFSY